MHHFAYRNGILHAENIPLESIADAVGTPFYCYSAATLRRHYRVFSEAFASFDSLICYSVKANSNIAVIKTLADMGAGADVVSGGELARALKAGVPAERIVFSGVGKTEPEMAEALKAGIHQFNVESRPELQLLNDVAMRLGLKAPITLRINPDVDARTHTKISTGRAEDKFGIPWADSRSVFAEAAALPAIEVVGVDVHIGSQLTYLDPFAAAFARVAEMVAELRADGHDIRRIDLGGGLGVPYDDEAPPLPVDYAETVRAAIGHLDCQVIMEPGRLIAANAGTLVSRVIYMKEGKSRTFCILDAAMNDLVRPAMYESYHRIQPVKEPSDDAPVRAMDFVGPVCETADTFARNRPSPPLEAGDLVAMMSAGAYGAVMSSTYNTRPLIPEVLVDGDRFAVVRSRVPVDDLIALETIPPWLDRSSHES